MSGNAPVRHVFQDLSFPGVASLFSSGDESTSWSPCLRLGCRRAIAEELASLGASVFLCARSEADVDAVVSSLRAKGATAYGWACDLTDRQQRVELMNRVKDAFGGRLNHLVTQHDTKDKYPSPATISTSSTSAFHFVWVLLSIADQQCGNK